MSKQEMSETEARTYAWFCWIARAEGLSLLALFFVAMPLKYGMGMLHATAHTGFLHGALFLVYLLVLGSAGRVLRLSWLDLALGAVASLLPAGTFLFERRLHRRLAA